MTFRTLMIHEIDVVKPGRKTSRAGDEVFDWSNPVRTATDAWVTWVRSTEDENLRDTSKARVQIFLQPGVDVENEDRIEWSGMVFDVVGPPQMRHTNRGEHHLEVEGRLVNG